MVYEPLWKMKSNENTLFQITWHLSSTFNRLGGKVFINFPQTQLLFIGRTQIIQLFSKILRKSDKIGEYSLTVIYLS